MKYLVVGLGNIGPEYEETRHNIGFKVLDAWAKASNIFFDSDRYAFRAEVKAKGRTFVLIKPTTYMNLSGKAVRYWLEKEKLTHKDMMVVTDDLALPFGKIRIKGKGSDGGHNGLKDINAILGRNDYARLRFGIGNEFLKGQQVDYVLGRWTTEEEDKLSERIEMMIKAIQAFGHIGIGLTMNNFNNK